MVTGNLGLLIIIQIEILSINFPQGLLANSMWCLAYLLMAGMGNSLLFKQRAIFVLKSRP